MNPLAMYKSLHGECTLRTNIFLVLLISFYLLSFTSMGMKYLPVIPIYIFPPNFWLWTLVTANLFNHHFFFLVSDIVTVFLTEKLLCPIWGWKETVKFIVIVQMSAFTLSLTYCFLAYVTISKFYFLYTATIGGLLPLLGGISVAARQMMPDNVIFPVFVGKMRIKHLPFVLCLILVVSSFFFNIGIYAFLAMFGVYSSWIYLRFFQRHANGTKGDSSHSFIFAGFFPNHLGPPVAIFSSAVYSMCVHLRICPPTVLPTRESHDGLNCVTIPVTLGDPQDVERRMKLAQSYLNSALSASHSIGGILSGEDQGKLEDQQKIARAAVEPSLSNPLPLISTTEAMTGNLTLLDSSAAESGVDEADLNEVK